MVKKKNNIYRNDTTNFGIHKINESNSYMNLSIKNAKSINFAFLIKNKEKNKKTELNSNKSIQGNLINRNVQMKKKIKNKINLRSKLKEFNKLNALDNISNTVNIVDNQSREINDFSNNFLIRSNRSKINEINNNILTSNQSNYKLKKKINLGNFKPFKFKNILLLQDLKQTNTFHKTKKVIDDDLSK